MKTPFFLFIVVSTHSLSSGQHSRAPVRDTSQNFLCSGAYYYIDPVVPGTGGGVTLASTRNQTCPLDVVQRNNELDNGDPVTFMTTNGNKGTIIHEFTDLNIEFPGATTCSQSTVWHADVYQGQRVVSTSGVVGNPGCETVSNWFKIQKYEDAYKLVFCPSVCNTYTPACEDIGTTIGKNGLRRLVICNASTCGDIGATILKVTFKKA